ncbi:MAG: VCBS repeat-containing protein [Planctomycetota bacterium]
MTCVMDWERDGDLDIVSGDIDGSISLVRNGSGDKALKFDKVEKLEAGGAKISTPGGNSGPVVVDWDGDGKRDLVVGCGDGSVLFFRNTAEKGEPVFAAAETLLPISNTWRARGRKDGPSSPHGYRSKLAVADWNGDGKLDLLVGDAYSITGKEPELTEEQEKQRDELLAEQKELQAKMQPFYEHWRKQYEVWYAKIRKEMGLDTELPTREFFETLEGETRTRFFDLVRKCQREDPKYAEYNALQEEMRKIWPKLRPFQAPRRTAGFVWLYART